MKLEIKSWISLIITGFIVVFSATGCKKDDDASTKTTPVLTTYDVTEVTSFSVSTGGLISSDGGSEITERGICWSNVPNPTIFHNKTLEGTGLGEFSSILIDLLPATTYYLRAYAINSIGVGYGSIIVFKTLPYSFTDERDGKLYHTVTIGNQVWMAENLAYLPEVMASEIGSHTQPCYYVYGYEGDNVDSAKSMTNFTFFGVLYNWRAAMAGSAGSNSNPSGLQGICPAGWHLPGNDEWTVLSDFLNGYNAAGGKLKETGTIHWNEPNREATNETGFTARAGGARAFYGGYDYIGTTGFWWSTSEYENNNLVWIRSLSNLAGSLMYFPTNIQMGLSVRCVKD